MDWFAKSVSLAYFPTKDKPLGGKWARLRKVAEVVGLSSGAKERLEWIIFYYTISGRNAKRTACYFSVSRKTFHKWLKRFDDKNLKSLEEKTRAPLRRRQWQVTAGEENKAVLLRKSHLKWGKKKLQRLYLNVFGEKISTWKIERVIRKHKLYPDQESHLKMLRIKAKRKQRNKFLITKFKTQTKFGFLWHIDTIIIWWYGQRRVIFTALEDKTKIAFARAYKTNSSKFSKDFLERLVYLVNGQVNFIHSDNGSEFEGSFEEACQALGVGQIYSRPHTPKDNPALERFNRTIQDEWLDQSTVGLDNISAANNDLTNWLIEYNNVRPHQSLDYRTPLEYAQQTYFQVLPMWSAST